MSVNNLYYLYIDTKIEGALEQLIRYFQAQVFNVEDCISVYCKYYKEIEKNSLRSLINIIYHLNLLRKIQTWFLIMVKLFSIYSTLNQIVVLWQIET